ncbi:MAG: hypothetical protein IKV03_00245 [Alphaproteobacteria bacterium]|nr:hypothetical protein [Alphaproteobacteria bacterium]
MKKLILLTLAILMISSIAHAECKGITFKGKSGASYCLSKHPMNWYSASAWCQAQGMNLVDVTKVCGSLTSTCSEFKLSDEEKTKIKSQGGTLYWSWSGISWTVSAPYCVNIADGGFGTSGYGNPERSRTDRYALCQ